MKRIASTEYVLLLFLFLTLPIGRGLTVDVAGFTVRPAYLPMAGLIALNINRIHDGIRNMPAAFLALVAGWVSLGFASDVFLSAAYTSWATFTIVFALSATAYLNTPERIHHWIRLYVTTGVIWAWIGIGQWILAFFVPDITTAWLGALPRIEVLTQEASYFALYLVPIAFVALGCKRFLAAGSLATVAVLTTSRAGLLALVAGGAFLLILKRDLLWETCRRYLPYLTIATVVVVSLPVVRETVVVLWEFVRGGFLLQDVTSAIPRLQTWFFAWEVFQENPIVGVGLGGYGPALADMGLAVTGDIRSVKTTNLWLELLAETGTVGFSMFAVWALRPLLHYRILRNFNVSSGVLAAVVASLAMFPFTQTWWRPYLWIPWITVAAWRVRPLYGSLGIEVGNQSYNDSIDGQNVLDPRSRYQQLP